MFHKLERVELVSISSMALGMVTRMGLFSCRGFVWSTRDGVAAEGTLLLRAVKHELEHLSDRYRKCLRKPE